MSLEQCGMTPPMDILILSINEDVHMRLKSYWNRFSWFGVRIVGSFQNVLELPYLIETSPRWDHKLKRTGVAHFLLMDCSNSRVIARFSRRDLTVRFEPAFVRSVVTSSLWRRNWPLATSLGYQEHEQTEYSQWISWVDASRPSILQGTPFPAPAHVLATTF
jgi:hypothetical protein